MLGENARHRPGGLSLALPNEPLHHGGDGELPAHLGLLQAGHHQLRPVLQVGENLLLQDVGSQETQLSAELCTGENILV